MLVPDLAPGFLPGRSFPVVDSRRLDAAAPLVSCCWTLRSISAARSSPCRTAAPCYQAHLAAKWRAATITIATPLVARDGHCAVYLNTTTTPTCPVLLLHTIGPGMLSPSLLHHKGPTRSLCQPYQVSHRYQVPL